MTIGMLLNAPYPSDVRVKKEADALLAAGHMVHLLCARRPDEKETETFQGIHIQRINAGNGNIQLAFWDVIMSMTFVHPVFHKTAKQWITKNSIQVLHVHDLPLAGTALKLREKFKTPVVVDFHENYPDALRTWFEWKKNPIAQLKNKFFMNPERWTALERKAAHASDRVIAVVDEMKNRLISDYQLSPDKITVVSNTEDKSFLNQPQDADIYKAYAGKFIVTYSGNIGPHRGVDTVIEAMGYLKNRADIVFVIVGSGSSSVMEMLSEKANALGVSDQISFLGRQPFEKFYSFMKFTNVNVIPHKSNRHTDNTIPHKLFQAMMTGKPLLVSSSAPLKRIVDSVNSGLVFEAGNAKDLADKIKQLADDASLQKTLGQNGENATIHEKLNWEEEQKKLISLYSTLHV
jgi:glycosyltransferase involved in cell wall biosynthesis